MGFSEINTDAVRTYRLIHQTDENNFGDLMTIDPSSLPDFDIMLGGFPCQTFSIMGKRMGLSDNRGLVFEGLAKILAAKKPASFMLENVKGLLSHDDGRTFQIIFETLIAAGYRVGFDVLKSSDFGIPQMRERCFLVGFRDPDVKFSFCEVVGKPHRPPSQFLIDSSAEHELDLGSQRGKTFLRYLLNDYNRGRIGVEDILSEEGLIVDTRQSDIRLYRSSVPTLRTGRHGIMYVRNGRLRSLSGFEAMLLQGFPVTYAASASKEIPNSKLLAQAGNAMTVDVVEAIARPMLARLRCSVKSALTV